MPTTTIPAAGQYGLVADQPAQELPPNAWSRVQNMRPRGGSMERVGGHQQIFDTPSVTPYFLINYEVNGLKYVIHCSTEAVYADDGSTRTDITGPTLTGASTDRWTGCVLNGVLVLNNGVDVPMFWNGTGVLAALTGWDSAWRCRSIGAYKAYLVAWGITKSGTLYPHMVKWSDPADPGTIPTSWDETNESGQAGEQDLAETTDEAVDQLPLGDANILYKQRSMYSMRWIGGSLIFEFRRVPGNYGMLARRCAAVTPRGHVVLANGDVVIHDGVSEPQSIVADSNRDTLFRTEIDSVNYANCFVTTSPSFAEVWVCYPEVGETLCTKALLWNWRSSAFGNRDLPNVSFAAPCSIDYSLADTFDSGGSETFDDDTIAFNQDEFAPTESRVLMASTDPAIYIADTGANFGETSVYAVLERTGLAFDDPDTNKLLRSLRPRIYAAEGADLYITFGGSMDAEVSPSWGERIPYTVGTTYKADGFSSGRFLAVRIESESGPKWAMKSFSLDIVNRGLY